MAYTPAKQLKVSDLRKVHEKYTSNIAEWNFVQAIFEGVREIVAKQLIKKHEREREENYARRMNELIGFGYTKSIVEIFNFYLFKKPPQRQLDSLETGYKLWKPFFEDVDMYGRSFDDFMMDVALHASVLGHMGILVDKAETKFENVAAREAAGTYTYFAKYFPQAILDWTWSRDLLTGRPKLMHLKLRDDDGKYRIWTPAYWEVWEEPKKKDGSDLPAADGDDAVFISGSLNALGEVPFIWHYSSRSKVSGIGVGDVHEISRIDLSIIRNFSQCEEIINFAAFPMMLKPKREASPTEGSVQSDDEVGADAILEFDPEVPDSKPAWLETVVSESTTAILEMVERKVSEIYRSANVGGMASTEIQTQARSGVAMKTEFQMLNSKLISKAVNIERTENQAIELWLKSEAIYEKYKGQVSSKRERTYDVQDLAADLENALTAKTIVISKHFKTLLQKQVARQALSNATEKDLTIIDKEIQEGVEAEEKAIKEYGSGFGDQGQPPFGKDRFGKPSFSKKDEEE